MQHLKELKLMKTGLILPCIICLILLSVLCPDSKAQGARFDSVAQKNVQGFIAPIPGATITGCSAAATGTPCSPITPIYTDAALTQQIPGSTFLADANGNFGFYAPASTTYKVSITAPGVTGQLLTVVMPMVGGGAGTFSKINGAVQCDGVINTTLNAAVAAAPSPGTVVVPLGAVCPVTSNLTIPSNIALQVYSPSLIAISNAVTLTINGSISAGAYQIFSYTGSGTVSLGAPTANGNIQNVWFPPIGTDCGTQNAHNALPAAGGVIHGENCLGTYGTLTFTKPVHFYLPDAAPTAITQLILNAPAIVEGVGPQTWLQCSSTTLPCVVYDLSSFGTSVAPGMGIRKMRLQGPGNSNASSTGISIQGTQVNIAAVTEDVEIDGFGNGVSCTSSAIGFSEFRRTEIFNNAKGLNFSSACSGEQVAFFGGYVNGNISGGSGIFACNLTIAGQADIKFVGTNVDYAQVCSTGGAFSKIVFSGGSYFECSAAICSTGPVISLTGSGQIQLDAISHSFQGAGAAGTHFLTATGGTVIVKGGRFDDNGSSVSDTVFSVTNPAAIQIEPWPSIASWNGPLTLSGTGTLNGNSSLFGGTTVDAHVGSAADLSFYLGNNAAGANQWQIMNSATGSATCGAGNIGFWNGSAICPFAVSLNGIANRPGLQIFNTTTTCTTGASVGATCTTAAITLPIAEPDTSYRVTCVAKPALTAVPVVISTTNSSASQFTITIAALTAVAASAASYDCVAGHN